MAELDFPTLRYLLQKFLPDERLIRAFEQLGDVVNENTDEIGIIRDTAERAYFLGFSAGAEIGGAPFPDMLVALPFVAPEHDHILPIPDASPMTPKLASGTYAPTVASVANVTTFTGYAAQWLKVGDVVTVSGKVDIEPAAAGIATVSLTLPIAADITVPEACAGAAASPGFDGGAAAVLGDAAGDYALLSLAATDTVDRSWFYTFTYRVN